MRIFAQKLEKSIKTRYIKMKRILLVLAAATLLAWGAQAYRLPE